MILTFQQFAELNKPFFNVLTHSGYESDSDKHIHFETA